MPHYDRIAGEYAPVVDVELQEEAGPGQSLPSSTKAPRSRFCLSLVALCTAICCIALGFTGGLIVQGSQLKAVLASTACKDPITRREWRSLSRVEKSEYIKAVQCLRNTPSRLGLNQTLYDDFPYVHSRSGEGSHDTAAFLSWHRYFIHVYESALRDQCGYTGHLTYVVFPDKKPALMDHSYWDWSLDWENITQAPIWDTDLGFGGDGDEKDRESVHGHCVTDGPFAKLEVLYVEKIPYPHCLSRGFASGENLTRFSTAIRPASLDELLRVPDYETFNLGVEDGPHLSIPRSVHGDFSTVTAPADPVFFLHHTQLDRLWWKWQQSDPQRRLTEYSGKAAYTLTSTSASLSDPLPMGGLAPDVVVGDIMNAESELLCYRY